MQPATPTNRAAWKMWACALAAVIAFLALVAAGPASARTNHDPVARENSYTAQEDTLLTVRRWDGVLKNDHDRENNRLFAKLVRGTSHGTVTLDRAGGFTYDSDEDHSGGDRFAYQACEQARPWKCSAITAVRINVEGVNDAPIAADNHYSLFENSSRTWSAPSVLGNDVDPEGAELRVAGYRSPANIRAFLSPGGSLKIVAPKNTNGHYTFSYSAADDGGLTDQATVSVWVKNR